MARRARQVIHEEDATSQGGWLFADSFLALMVVFLATISFVPALGGGFRGNATVNIGNLAGTNIANGMIMGYDTFDANRIRSDFNAFLKEQKLAASTHAIYVNIIGGYDPKDGPDRGSVNALKFAIEMKNAGIEFIQGAKIDLGNNKLLKPNQIVMRLTLAQ